MRDFAFNLLMQYQCSNLFGQSSHLHMRVSYFLWLLVLFVHTHCWDYLVEINILFAIRCLWFIWLSSVSYFNSVSIHNLYFISEFICDFETIFWNVLTQNFFIVMMKSYGYFHVMFQDRLFWFYIIFSKKLVAVLTSNHNKFVFSI